MPLRPEGETLARELTLGALSYVDLARRIRVLAERLFTRRLPLVVLVVSDPDRGELLRKFRAEITEVVEDAPQHGGASLEAFTTRLDEPLLLGPDIVGECRERGIEPPRVVPVSLLLIPLVAGGEKLGAVILGVDLPPGIEITHRWVPLAGATLVLAAVLKSCREHERTLAERADLEKVARAGGRLHVQASLRETSLLVARVLTEEFGFDRSLVLLVDEADACLEGIAGVGYEEICPLLRLPLGAPPNLFLRTLASETPWMAHDCAGDLSIPVVMRERGEIHEATALPLRVGGRALGLLWGDHREPRGWLTPNRLTLLTLYAAQAAAAISNARLLRRIETLSETDPLTQVANRRHLETILRREVARGRRLGSALSLLMVDIDQFKTINDEFGHEYGDRVLRQVAQLLKETMRETDFVARFGGDEFVVLMPDTSEEQALAACARFEQALERFNRSRPSGEPAVRLSLGLRAADDAGADHLLDDADRRMYESKEETLRAHLLEALIAGQREDILSRDPFVANSVKLLAEKEPIYSDHSRRVMQLVLQLGHLAGLTEKDRVVLGLAALLHDIGKISIPTTVLNRPGALSREERVLVRTHCTLGEDLLRGTTYLAPVRAIVRSHHERYDGRTDVPFPAYPDGCVGDEIPLGARILKLADCYDAITSWRCYRPARSPGEAFAILEREKGKSFDPDLTVLLLEYLRPHLTSAAPPPSSPVA